MIEASVYRIGAVDRGEGAKLESVVILKAHDQELYLPIWTGEAEAYAIAAHLQAMKPDRPLSHDLMAKMIEFFQGRVESVEIHNRQETIFHATLKVATGFASEVLKSGYF